MFIICAILQCMPRPHKNRIVSCPPGALTYKPAGIPAESVETVVLSLDEYEAINLLDYQGMGQETAAEQMGVSRPTVTRIYSSGRKKIAEALVEGKAITIEGGPVRENQSTCPRLSGEKTGFRCGQNRRRNGRCSFAVRQETPPETDNTEK